MENIFLERHKENSVRKEFELNIGCESDEGVECMLSVCTS